MEEKVHHLMDRMQRRHQEMKATWYGPFLSPVLLVVGFSLLIFGILILPTPAPGWLCIFVALGILSLVHPPTRRLNVWLARRVDLFYAWYHERHLAIRALLFILLVMSMAAIMGSVYHFMAPDSWPYTAAAAR